MRLDRVKTGLNKYALIKRRKIDELQREGKLTSEMHAAAQLLYDAGIIDWGDTPETEFFVIRLKDAYAQQTLRAYGLQAALDDNGDYATDIYEMAERSGPSHPNCKRPD